MKEFRKTEDGLFICEECGKTYIRKCDLSYHISHKHYTIKEYYDKWIKEDNEGFCKICGKEAIFYNFSNAYTFGCCKDHMNQWNHIQINKAVKEKYGVDYIFQVKDIKEKIKKKCLENYGVEFNSQRLDVKETAKKSNIKKYGTEWYLLTDDFKQKSKVTCKKKYNVEYSGQAEIKKIKTKETCVKRYGVEYSLQSEEIKMKSRKTCKEKYNVDYPTQNQEILEKGQKTAKLLKQYKNTDIWYQGSYELDFLEKYYNKFKIQRGPSIKYIFNNKNKVYHSDFYILSLNLVIEIKSSWTLKVDLEIEEKKKATISNGFNYIMILNKNYNEFNLKFI